MPLRLRAALPVLVALAALLSWPVAVPAAPGPDRPETTRRKAVAAPASPTARPTPVPREARHRRGAPRVWPVPPRLRAAVARIPGYRPGEARWVLRAWDGHWGTADVFHATVYVSPAVPARRLYDVVVHEWAHLRTVAAYDGDVAAAVRAVNAWFGGTGWVGSERAADCVARLDGATWTSYTSCHDARWRAGARRLATGLPLPTGQG